MKEIEFTKDFSHNGKPYKKGKKLKVHGSFKQHDIDLVTAQRLVSRGVAKEVRDDPKPTANRPAKK